MTDAVVCGLVQVVQPASRHLARYVLAFPPDPRFQVLGIRSIVSHLITRPFEDVYSNLFTHSCYF